MLRLGVLALLVAAAPLACHPDCTASQPCLCRDCEVVVDYPHCDSAFRFANPEVCQVCNDHGGTLATDLLRDGGLPDGGGCEREPGDGGTAL